VFKRLFWLMVGIGLGFGGSFWVTKRVRETIDRYRPQRMSADMATAVKGFGGDVRAAFEEGRVAARERELKLRADLEQPRR
jgi:hypothetical protein